MTAFSPTIEVVDAMVRVRLAPGATGESQTISTIVDETDFGELVGVEVLDAMKQIGFASLPPSPEHGHPRWSYDSEVDAFYLHVSNGRAQIQRKQEVQALLDADRRVVEFRIRLLHG